MTESDLGIQSIEDEIIGLANNPIAAAIGGAIVGGSIVGAVSSSSGSSKKKRRKASKKTSRKARRKRSYKYARTAGKGKDTSSRRIRMTKSGQPYVILKSGKARFISKKSARASRRRKGGRY